jgi:hypothetical protein
MTMVRSLGEEYSHFASSLMLLKSLDKGELKAAFLAEESQRRRRPDGPSADAALFTSSATCNCRPGVTCFFCEQPGHWCWEMVMECLIHSLSILMTSSCAVVGPKS